jgi:hypothetical protein
MITGPTENEIHFERERARSLASYKATLVSRDKDLAEARKSVGPASKQWELYEGELQSAKGTCQDIFASLGRLTDAKSIPDWFILLLAIGFAFLEAPINKFMLDNILQGSNFDSYASSLFLTLIMLLLAHIAGNQLRQIRGAYEGRWYWSKIVVAVFLLAVLSTCVGALTIGRAYYSTAGAGLPSSDIFLEIKVRVQNVGPWGAFVAALSDKAAFFLATLNLAGIAGALLLAFISNDSDMVYQSALDKADKTGRKLKRLAKKYDARNGKIAGKYSRRISNLATAYGAQNAEVIALKKARNSPLADEDKVDVSDLDQLLASIREEMNTKYKRPLQMEDDQARQAPQLVSVDRKMTS